MQKFYLAMVEKDGLVTGFNGKTKQFVLVTIENGLVQETAPLKTPLFMNREQGMLDWLKGLNVSAVVTTLASPDMLYGLQKRNIPALKSPPEAVGDVTSKFLKGELPLLGGCSGCKH